MEATTTPLPLRTPRRDALVAASAVATGLGAALLVRAGLGLDPWNVLAAGVAATFAVPFVIAFGVVGLGVLVAARAAIPGHDRVIDATALVAATTTVAVGLAVIPEPAPRDIEIKCAMLVLGVFLGGLGLASMLCAAGRSTAGEQLWEALAARAGSTPFQAQAAVQGTVGTIGFALGGRVNFGTAFAVLATGAIVRAAAPRLRMRDHEAAVRTVAPSRDPSPPRPASSAVPTS